MAADLFISYAWTSDSHREWVRLLASHMKAIGYDVLIDADVDYGDSLSGFMRRVVECRHVLLVVDENYVQRADHRPESGVGVETRWISEAHSTKPTSWLSVLFRENPSHRLPKWLSEHNPKGFSFNVDHGHNNYPGAEQVEELWRWMEDLPSDQTHAVTASTLRERAARLERVDQQRDPSQWASPALSGDVHFTYASAPRNSYRLGYGQYEFTFQVSNGGSNLVYVYADQLKAVGLIDARSASEEDLAAHIQSGRVARPRSGDSVVLMNEHGVLCRVDVRNIQEEVSGVPYTAPYVDFSYRIEAGV